MGGCAECFAESYSGYQLFCIPHNAKKLPWLDCSLQTPDISEEMEGVQFHPHLNSVLGNPLAWALLCLQALIRNPKSCTQDLIIKSLDFKSGSVMMETNSIYPQFIANYLSWSKTRERLIK